MRLFLTDCQFSDIDNQVKASGFLLNHGKW